MSLLVHSIDFECLSHHLDVFLFLMALLWSYYIYEKLIVNEMYQNVWNIWSRTSYDIFILWKNKSWSWFLRITSRSMGTCLVYDWWRAVTHVIHVKITVIIKVLDSNKFILQTWFKAIKTCSGFHSIHLEITEMKIVTVLSGAVVAQQHTKSYPGK